MLQLDFHLTFSSRPLAGELRGLIPTCYQGQRAPVLA
jgi:hypothetical protein